MKKFILPVAAALFAVSLLGCTMGSNDTVWITYKLPYLFAPENINQTQDIGVEILDAKVLGTINRDCRVTFTGSSFSAAFDTDITKRKVMPNSVINLLETPVFYSQANIGLKINKSDLIAFENRARERMEINQKFKDECNVNYEIISYKNKVFKENYIDLIYFDPFTGEFHEEYLQLSRDFFYDLSRINEKYQSRVKVSEEVFLKEHPEFVEFVNSAITTVSSDGMHFFDRETGENYNSRDIPTRNLHALSYISSYLDEKISPGEDSTYLAIKNPYDMDKIKAYFKNVSAENAWEAGEGNCRSIGYLLKTASNLLGIDGYCASSYVTLNNDEIVGHLLFIADYTEQDSKGLFIVNEPGLKMSLNGAEHTFLPNVKEYQISSYLGIKDLNRIKRYVGGN